MKKTVVLPTLLIFLMTFLWISPLFSQTQNDGLAASTYLGGNDWEEGWHVSITADGNVIVMGYTQSTDFPTTTGAYDRDFNGGNNDLFISILTPGLDALLYSTFLGGNGDEYGGSLAFDAGGNIYVTGETTSGNFPVTEGAYSQTFGGERDGFISVFTPDLSTLLYSTYLGGSNEEHEPNLAIGTDGNVYLIGTTESPDFPVTAGAFDETLDTDDNKVFVSVLSPDLGELLYSTYLGGSSWNGAGGWGNSIALDSDNNVYLVGITDSDDFPVTEGAYDEDFNNRELATFISVLSSDLSELQYSTFLGGSTAEWGTSLAIGSDGNLYVTGATWSDDFPVTSGAYDETFNGEADVFVSVLTPELNELLYSTYVGGSEGSAALSLAFDAENNVYITGGTDTQDFPVTTDAHNDSPKDIFVSVLSSDLSDLIYSTYLGGSGRDQFGISITADRENEGDFYVIGGTRSDDFPVVAGAFDTVKRGHGSVFITRFSAVTATSIEDMFSEFPASYMLYQNYPNPFNPSTVIRYAIPERTHVTLTVYNLLGQKVATLADGIQDAKVHEVIFDSSSLSSGIYLYKLQAGDFVETKKLTFLK